MFFTTLRIPAHFIFLHVLVRFTYPEPKFSFIYIYTGAWNIIQSIECLSCSMRLWVLSLSPQNLGMVVHGFNLQYGGGRSRRIRSHMSFPRYIHAKIRRWQELFESLSQSKNKQTTKKTQQNKTYLNWEYMVKQNCSDWRILKHISSYHSFVLLYPRSLPPLRFKIWLYPHWQFQ